MNYEYIIIEEFQSEQQMKDTLEFTIERVGRVSSELSKKSFIMPFKGDFPLLTSAEFNYIERQSLDDPYFDSLPMSMQRKVFQAEYISFYSKKFTEFILKRDVTLNQFKKKDIKEKSKILEDFIFSNNLDFSMLDVNTQV